MSFQRLDFWVSGAAENEKHRDTERNVVSRLRVFRETSHPPATARTTAVVSAGFRGRFRKYRGGVSSLSAAMYCGKAAKPGTER